jgi:phosphoesterase RecJ-like protein
MNQQTEHRSSFSEIREALRGTPRILVVSHARPDGDALGSTLAATLWLKNAGHQVTAWNEDGLPEKFSYLPSAALITKPAKEPQHFDAILILDTAAKHRLGEVLLSKISAPLWVAIDHHVSNEKFGYLNWIEPTAPATGEMLAEGFLSESITITPDIATNLYVAISTDTGSFQYSNTSARTLEIAASLVRAGVNIGAISQSMYAMQPRRRFELLRHALAHTQISSDGRIVSVALTMADAAAFKIQPEDTEGLIDPLRSIEGVVAALFFEELPHGKVRLSLRSKNHAFDASAFCQLYGGGGHHMAAGARLSGSLQAVEKEVLHKISESLSSLPSL